jgi:hypothetical protein
MRPLLALALAACGSPAPTPLAADAAPPIDARADVTLSCVPAAESALPACATRHAIERQANTVIDLRNVRTGRCDDGVAAGFTPFELPTELAAYPLLIRVSAAGFAGPCSVCSGTEPSTAFGVGFEIRRCAIDPVTGDCTDDGLDPRSNLSITARVDGPWTLGAGGCGKACAWPCIGGYQEFARSTCFASNSLELGVATDRADAPDAEIYVDLIPASVAGCCPYTCP